MEAIIKACTPIAGKQQTNNAGYTYSWALGHLGSVCSIQGYGNARGFCSP